jgi:hypothetical protein
MEGTISVAKCHFKSGAKQVLSGAKMEKNLK